MGLPTNTVQASKSQTIIISLSDTSDSTSLPIYKKKNSKMIKTSHRLSMFKNRDKNSSVQKRKASKVKIKGHHYWKIGKNKYVKDSKRVNVVNPKTNPNY
ncbi:hypothetical protein ABM34_11860 [Companilactobacillus ginsenosidimutans]|uniref:Surface layer protein A domain-containing protein n=1 Tax=Companilactobacillus ginsenosidimutans TaxID=1007676 RepID=A0A0H4QIA3_9LACO|nr:hypothetical protein ABM34_11860 [Companilactobacillus ginsenosidimutans]